MKPLLSYQECQLLVTRDGSHTMVSEKFGATYHSIHGAVNESNYVFIDNGLVAFAEEQNLSEISILEMGFGTGLNAYLTFLKVKQLNLKVDYVTLEAYPVKPATISNLNYTDGHPDESKAILECLHQCDWDMQHVIDGDFKFIKHLTKLEDFKSDRHFDLIYFDAFAPSDQPELWSEEIFQMLYQTLNKNGLLVTYCAQGQMKRHLKWAGFTVKALKGPPGKREMTQAIKY